MAKKYWYITTFENGVKIFLLHNQKPIKSKKIDDYGMVLGVKCSKENDDDLVSCSKIKFFPVYVT